MSMNKKKFEFSILNSFKKKKVVFKWNITQDYNNNNYNSCIRYNFCTQLIYSSLGFVNFLL